MILRVWVLFSDDPVSDQIYSVQESVYELTGWGKEPFPVSCAVQLFTPGPDQIFSALKIGTIEDTDVLPLHTC